MSDNSNSGVLSLLSSRGMCFLCRSWFLYSKFALCSICLVFLQQLWLDDVVYLWTMCFYDTQVKLCSMIWLCGHYILISFRSTDWINKAKISWGCCRIWIQFDLVLMWWMSAISMCEALFDPFCRCIVPLVVTVARLLAIAKLYARVICMSFFSCLCSVFSSSRGIGAR